ncbi:MAG: SufE family protein [Gemmatimonadetes bacterium]|jgi:cysteine desulfuration protein SufE|nr:SufE family protein [Gemmatimonadota bacterium]MBK7785849.1 SufE family protein [Gemmatimonadota bacterium]
MLDSLDRITRRFHGADKQTRLELLLDYSKKLPPLPDRYHAARDQGLHRVPECQSPVFLFLEREGEGVVLHADAPREAPTVRGFVSLLARALQGVPPAEVAQLPPDLLDRLGLAEALGMTRTHGLTAMIGRIRRMAGELT